MPFNFNIRQALWVSLAILLLAPFTVKAACDLSESENNGTFETAKLVSVGCIDNQSGLGISGKISNSSDVDVYKISGSFDKGDVLNVVYSVGGSVTDALATGIFRPDNNLLVINDHRNVFRQAFGPNTNFKFYNNEEFVYLSVSATPGYYETSSNYAINIKRNSGSAPQPRPQWLLLDFKGVSGARIGSRPPVDTLPLSSSWLATAYPGQIDYIKKKIVELMRLQMVNFNIGILTTDDPIPNNLIYSTVYFGAYDSALLGVAEGVDEYNASDDQNAIVFVETFKSFQYINPTVDEISTAIANVGSHEAGHLMGLVHTDDPQDIPDVTSTLEELVKEQNFQTASLYQAVYPIGTQSSPWLLEASVGEKALDLAVLPITLDNLGVSLRICNYSSSDLPLFPLQISINNIAKSFNAGSLNSLACQDKRHPYSIWGIIYDQRVQYTVNAMADPDNWYQEFDETNNWQSTSLGSSVSVISPNGGETFETGSWMEIRWSSSNVGAVNIYLIGQNGNRAADIAPFGQSSPNSGSYIWQIPSSIPNGNYYAVQVVDAFQTATYDFSDRLFSIRSGPSIRVYSPSVDDVWLVGGSGQTVRWESNGLPSGTLLNLRLVDQYGYTVEGSVITGVSNTGSYQVTLPNYIWTGALYRYEVNAVLNGQTVVGRSNLFTVGPLGISIIEPYLYFQWLAGDTHPVRWNISSDPLGVTFSLRLVKSDSGIQYGNTINNLTANSVNYAVPATAPTGGYNFRINAFKNGQQIVFDASSALFHIESPETTDLRINYPTGGETWPIGSQQQILFGSGGVPFSNLINYSIRNEASGQEYSLLINVPLTGPPPLITIPSSVPTGPSRVVIRTVANNQTISAMSNLINITSALPVSITVTSPNGGETWPYNSDKAVSWSSQNLPASAQVGVFLVSAADGSIRGLPAPDGDYYNNGYQPVSSFNFNAATYGDYWLKIEATHNGVKYSDQSDGMIKVGSPTSIAFTFPVAGYSWLVGANQMISWASSNISVGQPLTLRLKSVTGQQIGNHIPNIPNTLPFGNYYTGVPAGTPAGSYFFELSTYVYDSVAGRDVQIIGQSPIFIVSCVGNICPVTAVPIPIVPVLIDSPTTTIDRPISKTDPNSDGGPGSISPTPTLTASAPPNNAVMAQDSSGLGWKFAVLTFSSDLGSDWNNLANYSVVTTRQTTTATPDLAVASVSGSPYRPIIVLSRNIVPGERVTIAHKPTGAKVCLGFLPGDVDQNGWALSGDISLLNSWVGTATGAGQPLYKTDINRDGVFDAKDVTRAGELMADPNRVVRLSACPAPLTAAPTQTQLANILSALQATLGQLYQLLMSR